MTAVAVAKTKGKTTQPILGVLSGGEDVSEDEELPPSQLLGEKEDPTLPLPSSSLPETQRDYLADEECEDDNTNPLMLDEAMRVFTSTFDETLEDLSKVTGSALPPFFLFVLCGAQDRTKNSKRQTQEFGYFGSASPSR